MKHHNSMSNTPIGKSDNVSLKWNRFRRRLALTLSDMQKDEILVISDKLRSLYIQFYCYGVEGIWAEATSNELLDVDDQLTPEEHEQMLKLGWNAPTDQMHQRPKESKRGSCNYYSDAIAPVRFLELASLGVKTLRTIFRVQSTCDLEYSCNGEKAGLIRYPALGLEYEATSTEHREWYKRAKLYRMLGMFRNAADCYDMAVIYNPKRFDLYYKEAIECCDVFVREHPASDIAWFKKGYSHHALGNKIEDMRSHDTASILGNKAEAMRCYEAALIINPSDVLSLGNKASLLLDQEKPSEALTFCEMALKLSSEHAYIWVNRGTALNKLGNRWEALSSLQRGIELCPDDKAVQKAWSETLKEIEKYLMTF